VARLGAGTPRVLLRGEGLLVVPGRSGGAVRRTAARAAPIVKDLRALIEDLQAIIARAMRSGSPGRRDAGVKSCAANCAARR